MCAEALDRGRDHFARKAWGQALEQLAAAQQEKPLEVDDLERLATAAYLTGNNEVCDEAWTRAHNECLRNGDLPRAARCAFWLAFGLLNSGDMARGSGWLGRAQTPHQSVGSAQHCSEVLAGYAAADAREVLLWPIRDNLHQLERGMEAAASTDRTGARR